MKLLFKYFSISLRRLLAITLLFSSYFFWFFLLCLLVFLADRFGRKKPIILGLVMLGTVYAIVGLVTTPQTYFINLLLSGLVWGVIIVVYLVVPRDLSPPGSTERYYALG